ncbi:hypothetical protein ACGFZK_34665 [Streptomyces sp. NPDC048257]|uniref:hypothetical protein n=1 Tax=Streptomyces sp. NPDC048257 TaxID=3365526 RepID=UPI003711A7D3
MNTEKPQPADGGEGCLVGALRIPVKIVALLVVLPVRVVWDLLTALGRLLYRHVLAPVLTHLVEPLLRALGWLLTTLVKLVFVWPWAGLWRYLLRPVGSWLYVHLLAPLCRALHTYVLRPLALLTWRFVLVPAGRAVIWLAEAAYRYLLRPLYRYVLAPLGRALAWAWHVAGLITGALWRALRWTGRMLIARPAAQVYRYVLTPAGHLVRAVWRPVRDSVREVRAEVRRALFGTPPVEPARSRARTLGSTTAAGNTPAPEISLHERQG